MTQYELRDALERADRQDSGIAGATEPDSLGEREPRKALSPFAHAERKQGWMHEKLVNMGVWNNCLKNCPGNFSHVIHRPESASSAPRSYGSHNRKARQSIRKVASSQTESNSITCQLN